MGRPYTPIQQVPLSKLYPALEALGNNGAADFHAERLRTDPAFARRIAHAMEYGGFPGGSRDPRSWIRNLPNPRVTSVFGEEEWAALFEMDLPRVIPDFPWTETLMEPCPFEHGKRVYETHFAFLSAISADDHGWATMSVQRILALTARASWANRPRVDEAEIIQSDAGYLFDRSTAVRWYLMPHPEIILDRGADAQLDGYEPPTACEFLLGHVLYLQKYGTPWGIHAALGCADRFVHQRERTQVVVYSDAVKLRVGTATARVRTMLSRK